MNQYQKKEFKKVFHQLASKNFKFTLSTDEEITEPHDMKYGHLAIKADRSSSSNGMNLSRDAVHALYELIDHARGKIKQETDAPFIKIKGVEQEPSEWNL